MPSCPPTPPATGLARPKNTEIGRFPLFPARSYLIRRDAPPVSLLRRRCLLRRMLRKRGDVTRDGFDSEHRHSVGKQKIGIGTHSMVALAAYYQVNGC